MKQELIDLAFKHKFSSKFLYQVAYKYSTKEDLRYLFWMTELQQWLREVHNIYLVIATNYNLLGREIINIEWEYYISSKTDDDILSTFASHTIYEQALESGLLEALKLIK